MCRTYRWQCGLGVLPKKVPLASIKWPRHRVLCCRYSMHECAKPGLDKPQVATVTKNCILRLGCHLKAPLTLCTSPAMYSELRLPFGGPGTSIAGAVRLKGGRRTDTPLPPPPELTSLASKFYQYQRFCLVCNNLFAAALGLQIAHGYSGNREMLD